MNNKHVLDNPFQTRYYNDPPETKSLELCALHGSNHKEYGWTIQIDPRWSDEQVQAYLNAYETYTPTED